MPDYWYTPAACKGDDEKYNICTHKKPYFMMYIYDGCRKEYKSYHNNLDAQCRVMHGKSLKEMLEDNIDPEFTERYYKYLPLSDGNCTMNRICHYVEKVFEEVKLEKRQAESFDYSYLMYDYPVSSELKKAIIDITEEYNQELYVFKKNSYKNTKQDKISKRHWLHQKYVYKIEKLNADEKSLLNVAIELGFSNQFVWDCLGHLIIKRIEEVL